MRFFGQFPGQLDAKRRLTVPQAFRNSIGDSELRKGLVVTRGFDHCLWLFPASGWDTAAAELCRSVFSGADARMLERLFLGGAVEVSVDSQGRIELPPPLAERAGISDGAVFVGAGSRIEIWDAARWHSVQAEADSRFEELGEAFARRA